MDVTGIEPVTPLLAKQMQKHDVVVSSSLYLCHVAQFCMVFGSYCSRFVRIFFDCTPRMGQFSMSTLACFPEARCGIDFVFPTTREKTVPSVLVQT